MARVGRQAHEGLSLYSVGNGGQGKLCLGHFDDVSEFTAVGLGLAAGEVVTGLSCTHYVTAVWTSSGRAFMAGRGDELGLDATATEEGRAALTPLVFAAGKPVRQIACGYHFCLALVGGGVYSWGVGAKRQLGYDLADAGALAAQRTPCRVAALDGLAVRLLCAGEATSAAVTADGALWMWGANDDWQCACNGDAGAPANALTDSCLPFRSDFFGPSSSSPAQWSSPRAVDVALGSATLARSEDGRVYSWGTGGCLGHGADVETQRGPREIKQLEEAQVVSISCSLYHAAAVSALGDVYVWGRGGSRLGLGADVEVRSSPARVPGLSNGVSVVCTRDSSLLLCDDRRLLLWGRVGTLFPRQPLVNLHTPHRLPFRCPPAGVGRESPFVCALAASPEHVVLLAYSTPPDDRTLALRQLCCVERQHGRLLHTLHAMYVAPLLTQQQQLQLQLQQQQQQQPIEQDAEQVASSLSTQDRVRDIFSSSIDVHLLRHQRARLLNLYGLLAGDWFQRLPRDRQLAPALLSLPDAGYAHFFANYATSCLSLRYIYADASFCAAVDTVHYRRCQEADTPPPFALAKQLREPPAGHFSQRLRAALDGQQASFADEPLPADVLAKSTCSFVSVDRHSGPVPGLAALLAELFAYPGRLVALLQTLLDATPPAHRDAAPLRRAVEALQRTVKRMQWLAEPQLHDDAWSRLSAKYRYCRQFDRYFRGRHAVFSDRAFVDDQCRPLVVAFSPELLLVGDAAGLHLSTPLEQLWLAEQLLTSHASSLSSSSSSNSVAALLLMRAVAGRPQVTPLVAPTTTVRNWLHDIGAAVDQRLHDATSVLYRTELHLHCSNYHRRLAVCAGPAAGQPVEQLAVGPGVAVLLAGVVYLFEAPARTCNVAPRLLNFADAGPRPPHVTRMYTGPHIIVVLTKAGELWEAPWGAAADAPAVVAKRVAWLPRRLRATDVADMAFGGWHWGFVTTAGQVYTCGSNAQGALGIGAGAGDAAQPTLVKFPRVDGRSTRIRRLRLGLTHSVAVTDAGNVFCWGGDGLQPVLGLGPLLRRTPVPTLLAALGHVTIVDAACGDVHTVLLSQAGDVYICGPPSLVGALLPPPATFEPVLVTTLPEPAVAIACGSTHTLAVSARGVAYSWGSKNAFGQLARATATVGSVQLPAPVELSLSLAATAAPASSSSQLLSAVAATATSAFLVRQQYRRLTDAAAARTGWWTDALPADAIEDVPLLPAPVDAACAAGYVGLIDLRSPADPVASRLCTVFPPYSFSLNSLKRRTERKLRSPFIISFAEHLADFLQDIALAAAEIGLDLPEEPLLWFELTRSLTLDACSRSFFLTPSASLKPVVERDRRSSFFSKWSSPSIVRRTEG